MADKLLAEWFWTDRWMGSSGFLLPMLARGVYREMLTQAWRRGARLPNDPASIKRAIGATDAEWAEAWPLVSKYWRVDESNHLVNDTQLGVYAESKESADTTHERAIKGAQARWKQSPSNAQASAQAKPEECAPSPSPSPSLSQAPSQSPIPVPKKDMVSRAVAVIKANGTSGGSARSNRPIFRGQRFVVFDWMLDDISQMLGPAFEDFGLDEFFDRLDKIAARQNVVLPKPQVWPWIQSRVIAEAASRGLPVVSQAPKPHKRDVRDAEALALMRSLA